MLFHFTAFGFWMARIYGHYLGIHVNRIGTSTASRIGPQDIMVPMKTTLDTVRKVALGFPGVEEGTMHGEPAFKVGGQMFVCMASHKSAEPGTLAVRMEFERRDELIAADPDVYYLKDHYLNYPCVLVRMSRIHADALRDILGGAMRFVMAQKTRGKRATAPRRRRA